MAEVLVRGEQSDEKKEKIGTSIYFSILEHEKLVNVQWRQILHDDCNSDGCALV